MTIFATKSIMIASGTPRIEVYPSMAGVVSDIAGSDPIRRGVALLQGGPSRTIAYGNNTITGDEGDDFIVGDAARTVVQGAGPLRSLSLDAALALSDALSDMRSILTDLAMTGRVAQAAVTVKLETRAQRPLNGGEPRRWRAARRPTVPPPSPPGRRTTGLRRARRPGRIRSAKATAASR